MLYFILVFFALLIGFSFYSRRWANPYKLIHIFGKKGAGKSCLMVNEMLKAQRKGWHIYTDMKDCIIPGVRIIDTFDLQSFRPEYHSLVCLDEIGISFDNRQFKTFPTGLRDYFKLQRKYMCKVYTNSQAVDYDKKLRDVTDSMILQSSIFNCISVSRPIIRSFGLTAASADSDARVADVLKFAKVWHWRIYWMPKYFKYFDSFAAPERPLIPFTEVTTELLELRRQSLTAAFTEIEEEEKV